MSDLQAASEPSKANRASVPGWRWGILLLIAMLVIATIVYRVTSTHHANRVFRTPQAVGVKTVVTGTMLETLTALGTVTPISTVTVVPELSGYLTEVGFKEGQDVKKGQFLAQIDPRPYEAQLKQDQAALAKDQAALKMAESDLARYKHLAAQRSIASQQVSDQRYLVDEDRSAIDVDEANIESVKINLAFTHIVAPITGRVGLRLIDPGNYVTAGSSSGIVVITSLKPITVIFAIPQNRLTDVFNRLKAGEKLVVDAYNSANTGLLATGVVTAIDNQMSTATGTVNVRARFENANAALFPNEFVNVVLVVDTIRGATLAPTRAIQTGTPGNYVYVVNADNTVSLQVVKIGISNGVDTVINSGLKPGQIVVTDGIDRLTNGTRVMVTSHGNRHSMPTFAPGSTSAAP